MHLHTAQFSWVEPQIEGHKQSRQASLSKAKTTLITPGDDSLLSTECNYSDCSWKCVSVKLIMHGFQQICYPALIRESRRILIVFGMLRKMLPEHSTCLHESSCCWISSPAFSLNTIYLLFSKCVFLPDRQEVSPDFFPIPSFPSLCLLLPVLFMASPFFVNKVASVAQSSGMYRRHHGQAWQNIPTVRAVKSTGGWEMSRKKAQYNKKLYQH